VAAFATIKIVHRGGGAGLGGRGAVGPSKKFWLWFGTGVCGVQQGATGIESEKTGRLLTTQVSDQREHRKLKRGNKLSTNGDKEQGGSARNWEKEEETFVQRGCSRFGAITEAGDKLDSARLEDKRRLQS